MLNETKKHLFFLFGVLDIGMISASNATSVIGHYSLMVNSLFTKTKHFVQVVTRLTTKKLAMHAVFQSTPVDLVSNITATTGMKNVSSAKSAIKKSERQVLSLKIATFIALLVFKMLSLNVVLVVAKYSWREVFSTVDRLGTRLVFRVTIVIVLSLPTPSRFAMAFGIVWSVMVVFMRSSVRSA